MSIEIIFGIIILILSVVVHEVSHGYAANMLGDPTARLQGRLTLNPLAHLDPFGSILVPALTALGGGFIFGWAKPVPYNPYNINHKFGEAIVAFAGPLSNIVLAVIFGLFIRLGVGSEMFQLLSYQVVFINILLAVFNLLPIPPLDGSKILFNFLPYRFGGIRQTLESYGFFLVLLVVFFLWQLIAPIISFFVRIITGI